MSNYSQTFTLTDIFNNKTLAKKIPIINFKQKYDESGKFRYSTQGKTINRFVFDISKSAARPFYKPLNAHKSGDLIDIGGKLIGSQDQAAEAIYNELVANRMMMIYTVNNADMIRNALVEAEKNKNRFGIESKLYLRAQSIEQIQGMSNRQIQALLNNVMENIIYGDDFPKTQKKWEVSDNIENYEQQRIMWKKRVGAE